MRLETLSIYAYEERKVREVWGKVDDWNKKTGRPVYIAQYEREGDLYDGCVAVVFWVNGTSRENTERALGIRHDPELQIMWEIAHELDSQERIACKLNARHHKEGKVCTKAQYLWFDWEDLNDLRQVNLPWESDSSSDEDDDWVDGNPPEVQEVPPPVPKVREAKRMRGGVVPETP